MKHFKCSYLLTYLFLLTFSLSGCELFKDILEENPRKVKREDFIGLWKNDSLSTKVYTNGVLTGTTKQSLIGSTFEMRKNGTYTTAGTQGVFLNGTWELVSANNCYQILLDKGDALERSYDVKLITKNRLVTNRKVAISEDVTEEYTFSYFK
jgi:hypothetical protein